VRTGAQLGRGLQEPDQRPFRPTGIQARDDVQYPGRLLSFRHGITGREHDSQLPHADAEDAPRAPCIAKRLVPQSAELFDL